MPFEIALPDSSLSDCSNLRQKTVKIGLLARAIAVFKVEKIILYETDNSERYRRDLNLMDKLFRYMDTPQYLRRSVFPMSPSLKYAGLLPPLRTRSHPLASKISQVKDGEVRWGVQERLGFVDIGLDAEIEYEKTLRTRVPTLFQISRNGNRVNLEPIDRNSVDQYFGYEVEISSNLVDYLSTEVPRTSIVLSRLGIPFQNIGPEIESVLESTRHAIAVFGGPQSGVRDLVHDKVTLKQNVDFWVNTIPDQGTETVRLEEAVWISLGQFNSSFGSLVTKPGFYLT